MFIKMIAANKVGGHGNEVDMPLPYSAGKRLISSDCRFALLSVISGDVVAPITSALMSQPQISPD